MYQQPAAPGPKSSQWGALARIITEPSATFAAFADRPPVLPGYLLQMAFSLAGFFAIYPVTMALMESQLANTPELPPEMMGLTRTIGIFSGIVGVLIGPWIGGAVVSVLALFFGQFQGGGVGLTRYLGMVGYAGVPQALGTLLSAGLTMVSRSTAINLSASVFLPPDANPYLKVLLSALNPFSIWYYVLLAIGFAALHRVRPSRGTAFAAAMFTISLLLAMGGTALGRAIAPNLGM